MGVYNDMACDAGYPFGTRENKQMAMMIEEEHMRQHQEWDEMEEEYQRQQYEEYVEMELMKTCRHMWE